MEQVKNTENNNLSDESDSSTEKRLTDFYFNKTQVKHREPGCELFLFCFFIFVLFLRYKEIVYQATH